MGDDRTRRAAIGRTTAQVQEKASFSFREGGGNPPAEGSAAVAEPRPSGLVALPGDDVQDPLAQLAGSRFLATCPLQGFTERPLEAQVGIAPFAHFEVSLDLGVHDILQLTVDELVHPAKGLLADNGGRCRRSRRTVPAAPEEPLQAIE